MERSDAPRQVRSMAGLTLGASSRVLLRGAGRRELWLPFLFCWFAPQPNGDVRNGETVSTESHPPSVFSSAANLLLTAGKSLPLVLFPLQALVSLLSLEWQLLG